MLCCHNYIWQRCVAVVYIKYIKCWQNKIYWIYVTVCIALYILNLWNKKISHFKLTVIDRTFEICQASHVTKNLDNSCAKIRVVMNSKLSVFLVRTYTKSLRSISYLILMQENSQFLVRWLARQISNARTIVGYPVIV